MAKKKSWFSVVKRLFIWDTNSTQEQKEKRRKWMFGRLKRKKLPSIAAPPAASEATASAGVPQPQSASALQIKEKSQEFQPVIARIRNGAPQSTYQYQEFAAIKIQTAFRGYLARKALRALKGIVMLQAIIRGRAVRRQAMSTLKCLQSIVSIQSQVCARRLQGRWEYTENEGMQDSKDKIIRMDSNSERKRDGSSLLKEEVDGCKKEACVKRETTKEYSYHHVHRRSAESERSKVSGRWRYWLEQWVDTQLSKSKELEDLDSVFSSHSRGGEESGGRQLIRVRNNQRQNPGEGLDSPVLASRKPNTFPHSHSHSHRRQCSMGEENSFCATPAYMAATESAKAKARSTSSPKIRTGNLESYSPCKKKLSINSEEVLLCRNRMGKPRSPSFEVPIKSSRSRTIKDLTINSDCSLPTSIQTSFK